MGAFEFDLIAVVVRSLGLKPHRHILGLTIVHKLVIDLHIGEAIIADGDGEHFTFDGDIRLLQGLQMTAIDKINGIVGLGGGNHQNQDGNHHFEFQ